MRPDDDDDGFKEPKISEDETIIRKEDEDELYLENETHRNLNNTPNAECGRRYDRFFRDDGAVRRSMSLEDLRIEPKVFNQVQNRSTVYQPKGTLAVYSNLNVCRECIRADGEAL